MVDRRKFVIRSGGLALLAASAPRLGWAQSASLPDYYPESYGEIIEASKAEGNLLVYSNMSVDMWAGVLKRYKELYPWINVETLDLGSSEVMERYLAEQGTGSRTGDILVTVAPDAWINLVQREQIAQYHSPEAQHLPDWSIPYDSLYTIAVDPMLFIWNKLVLPEELVPTSFADLAEKAAANPEVFDGKMTCYGAQFGSFGYTSAYAFIKHHGEKGWEWLETVGPMTRVERSSGPMVEKVTTGEYVVGYLTGSGNPWLAVRDPDRAQILGWSFISDGTPVMMRGAAIPKASTNVNAARLWLDVMLSEPGQAALAQGGRTPYRPGLTKADVGGAYTYEDAVNEIGEENIILVDYDPDMVTDHEAFMQRWLEAYNL